MPAVVPQGEPTWQPLSHFPATQLHPKRRRGSLRVGSEPSGTSITLRAPLVVACGARTLSKLSPLVPHLQPHFPRAHHLQPRPTMSFLWSSAAPKGPKYLSAAEAQAIDDELMGPSGAFSLDQV